MANLDDNAKTSMVEYGEAVDETTGQTAVPLGPETSAIIILGRE